MAAVRPKLWNGGRKPSWESARLRPINAALARPQLSRLSWVSGTVLGAFSEPLVNSTTAVESGATWGTRARTRPGNSRTCSSVRSVSHLPTSRRRSSTNRQSTPSIVNPRRSRNRRDVTTWARFMDETACLRWAGPVVQLSMTGSLPAICNARKATSQATDAGSIRPTFAPAGGPSRRVMARTPTSSRS